MSTKGFMERLRDGEQVIIAEGYLFEFERRGYIRAGDYVPEVVLEHPDLVQAMYEEFVHAGSDVVLAFTYYAHREKLRHIGREHDLERINRKALQMARQVADETGTLMAGNICNSCVYNKDDASSEDQVRQIYKEQIEWAVEEGADLIIAETIGYLGEAKIALEAIKKHGNGLPAVVNMSIMKNHLTHDGFDVVDAMKQLEEAGADVVGVNCHRGPGTMQPIIKKIKEAVKIPVAALPVCYRTNEETPNFMSLIDAETNERSFPYDLDAHFCSRTQIHNFGTWCLEEGIPVVGLCCGNCAHYTRTLAESMGRRPPGSRFSPDMTKHYIFGNDKKLRDYNSKLRTNIGVTSKSDAALSGR